MTDNTELVERLLATTPRFDMGHRSDALRNPDGPAAATALTEAAKEIERLKSDLIEARELHEKVRRRSSRDGKVGKVGKVGELLDNQAWIVLSHVASQLQDHWGEPDLMEQWQEAYADGKVQEGYFTPHRGVAAWISREVRARQALPTGEDA